jgi:hypothetical protein
MQISVTRVVEGPEFANRAQHHQQNRVSLAHVQILYTRHHMFLITDSSRSDEYNHFCLCVLACGVPQTLTDQFPAVRGRSPSPSHLSDRSRILLRRMQLDSRSHKPRLAVASQFVLTSSNLQATRSTPSQCDNFQCDNSLTNRMHELPDDILITVFSSCDIETLFNLRLTCTSLCAVIQTYMKTIAPTSARITFPNCELLLTPPETGYSIYWLRNLIPAQLASIALDKDKLRRYPYINSGFLYGIPSESDCAEATYWRQRLANGWRVLQSFQLISAKVYSSIDDKCKRPNAFRKVSGGVRTSRIWQAVSCQYAGCTEHGMKHVFGSKSRRDSHDSCNEEQRDLKDFFPGIRRKEAQVLKRRLAHMGSMSDQDLLDYVYLWRILLHIFRPYRKPATTVGDLAQSWASTTSIPHPNWPTIISDIVQGCSWLNWFILHAGTTLFLTQWSLSQSNHASSNHIRDTIWRSWSARSTHQIEIEREYVSKFEFALRKRCLTSERSRRLEAETAQGRTINTISLDCIPWIYDQHHQIPRPPSDFPWYNAGEMVWLDGDSRLTCTPGSSWSQPGILGGELNLNRGSDGSGRGPLAQIPYLVYLGTESAEKGWPGSEGDGTELAF